MKPEQFNEIVWNLFKDCQAVMVTPGKDRGYDGEKFANFKLSAQMNNTTIQQEAWNFVSKQITDVRIMLKKVERNEELNKKQVFEVIQDVINYMAILYAMFLEYEPKHSVGDIY